MRIMTTNQCSICGSRTVPIIYGMPADPKLFEDAKRGDIELGGCVVWFDNPSRVCRGSEPHYWLQDGTGGLIPVPGD